MTGFYCLRPVILAAFELTEKLESLPMLVNEHGRLCVSRSDGVQKDDGGAIKWYRPAGTGGADLRNSAAPAIYFVGRRYLEGTGVARDEVEARKWFERSAEGGYGKAAEQLAQPSH